MGLTSCCCVSNTCGCTWPASLTFRGSVAQAQASFYFTNRAVAQPEPVYTLTWQARPSDIPATLELYYYSSSIPGPFFVTMPDQAWFSPPIPAIIFTVPTNVYFYMWVKNCISNVMVIDAPYGRGTVPDGTKGAGNGVGVYQKTSCTPFQMKAQLSGPIIITGNHGTDDITPDATGSVGFYTN